MWLWSYIHPVQFQWVFFTELFFYHVFGYKSGQYAIICGGRKKIIKKKVVNQFFSCWISRYRYNWRMPQCSTNGLCHVCQPQGLGEWENYHVILYPFFFSSFLLIFLPIKLHLTLLICYYKKAYHLSFNLI